MNNCTEGEVFKLRLVTNLSCNADENESVEIQNESIRKVEELLKNKELIKKNGILKKYFEEMENLVKTEGKAIFLKNFAILKENVSEIENFISDYRTLEEWERSKGGWTWKEKFEVFKTEYEKISGKKFVSFKEAKSEVINLIKTKLLRTRKNFANLEKKLSQLLKKLTTAINFTSFFRKMSFISLTMQEKL